MAGKHFANKLVLVVNIEDEALDSNGLLLFNSLYADLITKLKAHHELQVEFINSLSSLQSKCIENNPVTTVLLLTNELVAENEMLLNIVRSFVNGGALAIFGCLFASFTKPDRINKLFGSFNLPWKIGGYNSATLSISPVGRFLLNDYEETFFAKVHMLTNVLIEQRIYTPVIDSTKQQTVLLSETVDKSLAMATFSKVGKGGISYIGNHNTENGFIRMMVALCSVNF